MVWFSPVSVKRKVVRMSQSACMLEVRQICKSVPDAGRSLHILRDVSLSLAAGRSLAITGASGSGKSTLLGLMAGLDTPDSGEVLIDGQALFSMDEEGRAALRARRVGFVFQSFQLLDHLTACENVSLPLELARAPDARRRAETALEQVGMSGRLNHFPTTLSGGEQQRVAIARAFVTQPAIIFADEPTGSLDAQTGERVMDLLFSMCAQSGTTLVLVTHDSRLAAKCDSVFEMKSGAA